jgi:dual specificity tyrosine-phosphorylation-regulated kinase 2/3/4
VRKVILIKRQFQGSLQKIPSNNANNKLIRQISIIPSFYSNLQKSFFWKKSSDFTLFEFLIMHGISPRFKVTKLRPASNSIKIGKNMTLNLSATHKTDSKPIKFESVTPKQSSSRNSADKSSMNFTINSSSLGIKLNGSFNRSYGNISREEIKSARPRKKVSLTTTQRRNSQVQSDLPMILTDIPIGPHVALKQFPHLLSKYELAEIMGFSEIYYLGFKPAKISGDPNLNNYGFDDDRSDYRLVPNDHISYRYEILQILGKGSFGQVVKCLDHRTKQQVAVKIIRNEKRFHRQGKIEVKVLEHIKKYDSEGKNCMIFIVDSFIFRRHLCITFELLNINLYELIKSNNLRGFSSSLIKRFAVQILHCLSFLKTHKIIHCDLKPENILLRQPNKSGIKVIDFGSSCFEAEKIYTYIQSRFYRAPEIILGIPYTTCIDMWSFGCILAELTTGFPLFPGESEAEQLLCIMEVKGVPPQEILMISSRRQLFFEGAKPKIVANSRGKKRVPGTRRLEEKVGINDPLFLDLLERKEYLGTLDWNPLTRICPDEALVHPWLVEQPSRLKTGKGYN